jgi:hypothetical protein
MSAETRKVLELLAEGKITADDADKLLEKLSSQPSSAETKTEPSAASSSACCSGKPRYLRIVVDKPGQDQVNVRMPLAFARRGAHLLAVLPVRVREKLADQGIDITGLGGMDDKEWADAIETLNIDIEKGDGRKVRVFCE